MQTLQEVGKGESSKFFFPMELTKLVEGISEYMGSANSVPDREVSDTESIRQAVGDPDDILGPIPSVEEIRKETESVKDLRKEIEEVDQIVSDKPKE